MRSRLLLFAISSLLLLSGCPTTSEPVGAGSGGGGGGEGGGDGGVDPSCHPRECVQSFRYPAADGVLTVELKGSFDNWGRGHAFERKGEYFEVEITLQDGERIEYKFVVNGTDWVEDPEAQGRVDSGGGNFNSLRVADCNTCPATGTFDWRDGIMYFVFVDRFYDGDPKNNQPISGVPSETNYHGGDLKGVLTKIEDGFFTDLGVNVLWLTAPVDNADGNYDGYSGYHGYWPKELDRVDEHLGTMDDLRAVVDAAHARGIRVVLDYVMNHVHTDSSLYNDHRDWFWPLEKPGGGQCTCGGDCSWAGEEGRRCWFVSYLADFNFQNPAARDYSVDNAIQWIVETGVDGYRLDAVKHIETQWILDLHERVKAEIEAVSGEKFYMVGETFDGDRGLIGSYVNPDTMLDGQFDFPLRAELVSKILRREGSMGDLAGFISDNDTFYHPGSIMGTFIGNHDLPRPVHIAEDWPMFDPWDPGTSRAWNNRPSLPDYAAPFERLAVAYAFLMTSPGIPLLYYGDEVGMPGGGDPDNRRPMQWNDLSPHQQSLRDRIVRLTRARNQNKALRRGTRSIVSASHDGLVYEMRDADSSVFVALNRADYQIKVEGIPEGSYTDLLTGETLSSPSAVGPRSALVLVAD